MNMKSSKGSAAHLENILRTGVTPTSPTTSTTAITSFATPFALLASILLLHLTSVDVLLENLKRLRKVRPRNVLDGEVREESDNADDRNG
jgi:hypothetical protein